MTRALALVAVAGSLAACGNSGTKATADTTPVRLMETTAAASGELDSITWGLAKGEPITLDSLKSVDYSPNTVISIMCDNLLRMNPDFTFSPGLATSWRHIDPRTLVYEIRDGVRFWNGKPLTAEDVVESLRRNMDPDLGPANATYFRFVKSIDATGPLQVTVRFTQPDALFHKQMATVSGSIAEAAFLREQGRRYGTPSGGVMCTGPYRFSSWQPGQSITVEANDEYWDERLRPKVRRIDFKFLQDSSTLTNALLSGDVDGAYEVPVGSKQALEKATSGRLHFGPSLQMAELLTVNQMADVRLRKAINLAIDKDAIARTVYGSAGQAYHALVPPTAWESGPAREVFREAYDALPKRPDLEAAKQLVAEVGELPRPLAIAVRAGDQTGLRVATFTQAAAKSVGLPMEIKALQPTTFGNLFLPGSKRAGIDLIHVNGYLTVPDPLDYVPLFTVKDNILNYIGYDDPEVTRLVDEAQRTLDPQRSAEALVAAQEIYEPLAIPLVTPYTMLFLNERISGAPASFAYIFSPWAASLGGTQ